MLQHADTLLARSAINGYRLANQRFIWGSNKMSAEEGVILCLAYRLTGEQKFFQAAVAQLDYLLGRNHFSKCFITGVGSNPVVQVSHIFARAKNLSIPGLMVGGPNTHAQSNIAPKNRGPLSYVDDARCYATNEYAIDYNASIIGLMVMVMEASIE
ncbi:MAG: glycoside hydrolase family 9 protein [bacterium]